MLEELQSEDDDNGGDCEVRHALSRAEEAVGPGWEARPGARLGGERPPDQGRHHEVADTLRRAERAAGTRREATARRLERVEGPRHGRAGRQPRRPGGELEGAVAAAGLGLARDRAPVCGAAPERGRAAAAEGVGSCG